MLICVDPVSLQCQWQWQRKRTRIGKKYGRFMVVRLI